MFAIQHTNVTPDILCCAKSLAGGLPMGAVLIGRSVHNLQPGLHGSTFGGNPLACAAGLAAINAIENEQLSDQAAVKGQYLMDQLRKIQSSQIREVRGLGLMVGIELKTKAMPYIRALQDRKILALNAGLTVIRLLPPLVISTQQIDQVVAAIEEVLALHPSELER